RGGAGSGGSRQPLRSARRPVRALRDGPPVHEARVPAARRVPPPLPAGPSPDQGMVGAALEALVGEEASPEALAAALTTIPATELADSLKLPARQHRTGSVPLLRPRLHGRPDWAIAAAEALGTVSSQAAADALAEAERPGPPKAVRTALRRALYRLRQAGVTPTPAPAAPKSVPPAPVAIEAWVSA